MTLDYPPMLATLLLAVLDIHALTLAGTLEKAPAVMDTQAFARRLTLRDPAGQPEEKAYIPWGVWRRTHKHFHLANNQTVGPVSPIRAKG